MVLEEDCAWRRWLARPPSSKPKRTFPILYHSRVSLKSEKSKTTHRSIITPVGLLNKYTRSHILSRSTIKSMSFPSLFVYTFLLIILFKVKIVLRIKIVKVNDYWSQRQHTCSKNGLSRWRDGSKDCEVKMLGWVTAEGHCSAQKLLLCYYVCCLFLWSRSSCCSISRSLVKCLIVWFWFWRVVIFSNHCAWLTHAFLFYFFDYLEAFQLSPICFFVVFFFLDGSS